jgi:hypothetical protein
MIIDVAPDVYVKVSHVSTHGTAYELTSVTQNVQNLKISFGCVHFSIFF